jgi:hypothetical protein
LSKGRQDAKFREIGYLTAEVQRSRENLDQEILRTQRAQRLCGEKVEKISAGQEATGA